MTNDLPEGWASPRIVEVCELNPPKPPKKHLPADAPVTFVPMAAIDEINGIIRCPQEREFSSVRNGYTAFREGDVLMAKITPCMENGKAAVARGLKNGIGFGSSEFHVLRPTSSVLAEFLFHFIRQESFRKSAEEEMAGSVGQERVPSDFLESAEIPLPPIAEQRRIVEKVEALLARVNAARERLARVRGIMKRFRQSVLAAACSGRLTEDWREQHRTVQPATALLAAIAAERARLGVKSKPLDDEGIELPDMELPETWTWCRVREIADVRLGGTPSRKVTSYWNGDVSWVSSGEVANCLIRSTAERITQKGLENSNAKLYPEHTVLIAMIGEGKTRGQAALLEIAACTNQNVAGLVFDPGNVNPEYIWYWALSEYEKNRNLGRGGNQPALNGAKVRALPLPLPPLVEQREIVRRVEALFTLADGIERRLSTAAARSDKLTPSILAKAFRGDLVPSEAELARQQHQATWEDNATGRDD